MTQLGLPLSNRDHSALLRGSLYLHTREGSKIRRLGEMLLQGPMTTGQITAAFLGTPSIFCQMRRTLRGLCKWDIRKTPIEGSEQVTYKVTTKEG